MTKNKVLIVDGDNLCHRAYHKFKGLTSTRGESTSVIYGFIYVLQSMIKRLAVDQVYAAFDGGRSEHRMKVHPGYKDRGVNLDLDYEDFQNQKKVVMDLLPKLNVSVVHGKGQEADDLIYFITKRIGYATNYITILSSDKDFNQLLGPNIKIFNPFKNEILTEPGLMKLTGYTPIQFIDYLILKGDKSDRIPGVHGMGEVRIKKFMDQFSSIEDYLDQGEEKGWKFDEIEDAYYMNNILINLRLYYVKYLKRVPWSEVLRSKEEDLTYAHKVMAKYEISILNKPNVINLFQYLS